MSIRVKICGLRRPEDVAGCVEAGVNALGFNFYRASPRYIDPDAAASLVALVPPQVMTVGLFVGASPDEVAAVVKKTRVRSIQLHGEEDPQAFIGLGTERVQVIRVRPSDPIPPASPAADWVLLDAWVEGFGGKGQRFDWRQAEARIGKPVMVAGGVTPENVRELLEVARPAGVDVASGVELKPGIKDLDRVRSLVQTVRAFETKE